jgi:hypothetical protein
MPFRSTYVCMHYSKDANTQRYAGNKNLGLCAPLLSHSCCYCRTADNHSCTATALSLPLLYCHCCTADRYTPLLYSSERHQPACSLADASFDHCKGTVLPPNSLLYCSPHATQDPAPDSLVDACLSQLHVALGTQLIRDGSEHLTAGSTGTHRCPCSQHR